MSLATFRALDLEGKPLSVKPPRYSKGRLIPQSYRQSAQEHTSDFAFERKAQAYVQWLAARDKIKLPTSGKIQIGWSGVYTSKRLNRGHKTRERRIRAVEWGHDEMVYNTRKDGRRGAYLYTAFIVDFEFELPNWDWQPEMTDESPQLMAA